MQSDYGTLKVFRARKLNNSTPDISQNHGHFFKILWCNLKFMVILEINENLNICKS
jgi:hypothetical protein